MASLSGSIYQITDPVPSAPVALQALAAIGTLIAAAAFRRLQGSRKP